MTQVIVNITQETWQVVHTNKLVFDFLLELLQNVTKMRTPAQ